MPNSRKSVLTISVTVFFLISQLSILVADTIIKNYSFDLASMSIENHQLNNELFQQIQLKNCQNIGINGEPVLPYHSISFLLPAGHVAKSVTIIGNDQVELEGKANIIPKQFSTPLSVERSNIFSYNESIYNSNSDYPAKKTNSISTEYLNGYAFGFSTFTPVNYNPVTGKVSIYKSVIVTLETENGNKNSIDALKNVSNRKDILKRVKKLAQNNTSNYDLNLLSYNSSIKVNRDGEYENLIITDAQFVDDFEVLISHYLQRGIRTEIVTTDYINSNMSGVDEAEKMRNFIIDQYQNKDIQFVLLGGDVEHVTYRGFYCSVQSSSVYEDDNIPSDLYFSALDGTWNDDNDDKWGEIGEDDLLPEVSVGRLSFSNSTELANMLNKTTKYQNEPVLGELKDLLLAGEHLYSDPQTWGAQYIELTVGFQDENGYTSNGIPEDSGYEEFYDRDLGYSWSGYDMIDKINEGKSFIHHCGHANYNYAMRLYNSDITSSNFSQINGITHNFNLIYTHGCICGAFDDNDCIAEKMTTLDNFAVGFIGNSRYGWFNEGQTEGPSAHIHREFIDALYGDKTARVGTAHMESKIDTAPWVNASGQHEEGALRWCFYDCNVLADPALAIWTDEPIEVTQDLEFVEEPADTVYVTNVRNISTSVPLENFTCTFFYYGHYLGSGVTDENGNATIILSWDIDVKNLDRDTYDLVISGYNCKPTIFQVASVTDIDESNLQISNFQLKQNYPNPFNPTTKIGFKLAVSSEQLAEIVVYNAMGQQVWSSQLTAHSSQLTGSILFDGSKFDSGVYYYSLIVDGKNVETKAMILVK